MADDIDLPALAHKTEGYSGADITNICRFLHIMLYIYYIYIMLFFIAQDREGYSGADVTNICRF
jgi:hypothetical protein